MNTDYTYPISEGTLRQYASELIKYVLLGENVTSVWLPMAGRRRVNKYLLDNMQLFGLDTKALQKYIFVYIDPIDIMGEDILSYLKLILKRTVEVLETRNLNPINKVDIDSVIYDEEISYALVLDKLKDLVRNVTKSEYEFVFFLGEYDELEFINKVFSGNLKSIWNENLPRVHFVFLLKSSPATIEKIYKWGEEFAEIILQNIFYVPLLSDSDVDYLLTRLEHEYNLKISNDQMNIMKLYCGDHPYMFKVAVRLLIRDENQKTDLGKLLEHHYELQSVANRIVNNFSDRSQKILKLIVMGKELGKLRESADYEILRKMRIILVDHDRETVNGMLLEAAVKKRVIEISSIKIQQDNLIRFDQKDLTIIYNDTNLDHLFTKQEFEVIRMLLNRNEIVTRDTVGQAMWGQSTARKYSDWAIDQLISKLRKKLKNINARNKIITVRGKGYKMVSI